MSLALTMIDSDVDPTIISSNLPSLKFPKPILLMLPASNTSLICVNQKR